MKIKLVFHSILIIYLFSFNSFNKIKAQNIGQHGISKTTIKSFGGIIRGDTSLKNIYLVFTGGEFNDGGNYIRMALKDKSIKANFFFTGDFYRLPENKNLINALISDGHYLGPHSDKHLLYASWENRDSLLVDKALFKFDLLENYRVMEDYGIYKENARYFMPPFEWYNEQICSWTEELGLTLVNYTPGTRSNADYTTPDLGERYVSSEKIFQSITDYEVNSSHGLNGFILLLHVGSHPDRTDKFYYLLPQLLDILSNLGYNFALFQD